MKAARLFLRAGNALVSLVVICSICLACAYSVYALWDNQRIYTEAENVQDDMLKLKPVDGATFAELLAINPDVCAWVTMDGTNIDYPVLQGKDNLSYINTDVYGNFALAGSIFLDTRCDRDFTDLYSLLYGHHMEGGRMFGDLDLYKDESFFYQNTTGTLILPDRTYNLEIYACLLVSASEEEIFDTTLWQHDIDRLLDYAGQNALYIHADTLEKAKLSENIQVLALTTCAAEFTDARTVVLAIMEPQE